MKVERIVGGNVAAMDMQMAPANSATSRSVNSFISTSQGLVFDRTIVL